MNEADVIAALRGYWVTNGPSVGGSLLWEDDTLPVTGSDLLHQIRFDTAGNVGVTIGRTRFENRGAVIIEVRSPKIGMPGPGPGERYVSAICDKWRLCRIARIALSEPSPARLQGETAFNRWMITVGWRADLRPV